MQIEVKNLSFAYDRGKPILQGVSFSVREGEVFVIAGLSGSGKTTLCQILCGIIPNAVKGHISGDLTIMDIGCETALPQYALRVGMVFQDADSQIICTTVEDELAFGLENLCIPPQEISLRVDALLEEFGLSGLREVNPNQLSGGQKKLLTIAAVLAPAPPILILDEPMSGLDYEGRVLVRSVIENQRRQGRTVIITEHDLNLVTYADKWLLLHDGAVAACDRPIAIARQKNLLKELRLLP